MAVYFEAWIRERINCTRLETLSLVSMDGFQIPDYFLSLFSSTQNLAEQNFHSSLSTTKNYPKQKPMASASLP